MKTHRKFLTLLGILLSLAVVAAACGNDDDDDGAAATDQQDEATEEPTDDEGTEEPTEEATEEEATEEATEDAAPAGGGELILAAEQWPECLTPVGSCANASWLQWSVLTHVLPRAMELDIGNNFVPSPVLVEEPTVENGGLVVNDDGTFVLTFNIAEEAVWSDGTPVTCSDFEFTTNAALDTTGTLGTQGFELVTEHDCSDPKAAVITFSEAYAPWPDLWGGTTNYLLPAHVFEDTDISDEWIDFIPVSGGPWLLDSWSPQQVILVPNDNYWDESRFPFVDRVVMVPREDTDTEIVALESGEVMGAYPQGFPGARDRLVGDIAFEPGRGTFMEGFWINQLAPDRNFEVDTAVRQALAYSLDRDQITETAIGSIIEGAETLQCAGWNPAFGPWCQPDFEIYQQDLEMVESILTEAGWTRPDPDGLWVNADGEELVLQFNTVTGNARREDVQALVVEMTRPFGIGWEVINYDAGELFQNRLPILNFGPVALYANSTSPDPSVVALYTDIPTEENEFSGQNYTAWDNQTAADLATEIDATVDPAERLALVEELGALTAEEVPWIPLYMLPNICAFRSDMVGGEVCSWADSSYSGFANIYEWTVTG